MRFSHYSERIGIAFTISIVEVFSTKKKQRKRFILQAKVLKNRYFLLNCRLAYQLKVRLPVQMLQLSQVM